jgi:hypothetical protein
LEPSSAIKLEKTLERSINHFIDAQSMHHEGDYSREIEEVHIIPPVNQSHISESEQNPANNSSMISRMADQL